MKFDPTISLGVLVHIALLLLGVVGAYYGLRGRIDGGLAKVEHCLHQLHAENSSRLDVLEARVGDLWRHFLGKHRPPD